MVGRAMTFLEQYWSGVPILLYCVQCVYLEPGVLTTAVSRIRLEGASNFHFQHDMCYLCAHVYGIVHTNSTEP